jgi:outer membrane biosynthesis protein TonB
MDSLNEAEDLLNDPKGPTAHGNIAEEDKDADGVPDEIDDDVNIEEMSTEDLESFIKEVIADMVSAGELEAGEENEGEEEGEEVEGEDEDEEEEIDIDSMVAEIKKAKAKKEDVEENKVKKMEQELKEAYDTLKHVKSELNEVNLFNAKLLYTNKIFRNKNLSESQKVKVLAAFDKAVSVKEAKLVYETLSEGLKQTKAPVNESLLRGAASKVSGIAPKKPILEVNNQVNRWQILAGIKKL